MVRTLANGSRFINAESKSAPAQHHRARGRGGIIVDVAAGQECIPWPEDPPGLNRYVRRHQGDERTDGMGLLGAYGHSWVFGAGASRPENGFAARAAAGLGLGLDNRAQSATVSAENAAALRSWPPSPATLFVLMAGLNDARLHGRSAPARQDYAANIDTMLRALGPVPVVVLAQPHLVDYSGYPPFDQGSDSSVDAYNAAVEDVVSRHDFACVAGVAGWDSQSMIADDGVHPNDSGHEQLAGTVIRAVRDGGFAKFLP